MWKWFIISLLFFWVGQSLANNGNRGIVSDSVHSVTHLLPDPSEYVRYNLFSLWDRYKRAFNRQYANSKEEERRVRIFSDTLKSIIAFNKQNKISTQSLNQFADLSEDELRRRFTKYEPDKMDEFRKKEEEYKKDKELQVAKESLKKKQSKKKSKNKILPRVSIQRSINGGDDPLSKFGPSQKGKSKKKERKTSNFIYYHPSEAQNKNVTTFQGHNQPQIQPFVLQNIPILSNLLNVASGGKVVSSDTSKRKYNAESVNWEKRGACGKVINQGECDSCWSFATTATIEAQLFKLTNNVTKLSEQQLVDCFGGCKYNNVPNSYSHIMKSGGIMSEKDYGAYTSKPGGCRFDPKSVSAKLVNFHTIPKLNEAAMADAVYSVGPITAWIKITKSLLMHSKGVYCVSECDIPLTVLGTHLLTIVGFGREDTIDYWLVKNSWGSNWGENGYGKILRNTNMCGIAEFNYYPEVMANDEDDDDDSDESSEEDDWDKVTTSTTTTSTTTTHRPKHKKITPQRNKNPFIFF